MDKPKISVLEGEEEYVENYYEKYKPERKYLRLPVIAGEIALTIGVIGGLFVAYHAVYTDIVAGNNQQQAVADIRNLWQSESRGKSSSVDFTESPESILHIPAMSSEEYPMFAGTDDETLQKGLGRYDNGTKLGDNGNVAFAGHRDGWNSPLSELDKVGTCDEIIAETADEIFTYNVVSTAEDADTRKKENEECFGASTASMLNDSRYSELSGNHIVDPARGSVVWNVPNFAEEQSRASLPLMTLTTCHPHWSNAQRMIVHAVLVSVDEK